MNDRELRERVMVQLDRIVDPCSVATNVPLSIVEMGMLTATQIGPDGAVTVDLRITSPMCHQLPYFQMEIEQRLKTLPGVSSVTVTHDHGQNWKPEDMTQEARSKLSVRRNMVSMLLAESSRK